MARKAERERDRERETESKRRYEPDSGSVDLAEALLPPAAAKVHILIVKLGERHGVDVEAGQHGLLVRHGGVVHAGNLGGEDDAHVGEVDVDRAEVGPRHGRAVEDGYLGHVLQGLPLSGHVLSNKYVIVESLEDSTGLFRNVYGYI